jgi:hypothetical protein
MGIKRNLSIQYYHIGVLIILKKYFPSTATPTLAQFLVFEVYPDRVVFHVRNTGTHADYHRDDKLKEYTVYLV